MLRTAPLPRASRVQALVMLALPHGGQAVARRNAWAGMSADAARSRERRQAESALAAADVRAYATDWERTRRHGDLRTGA